MRRKYRSSMSCFVWGAEIVSTPYHICIDIGCCSSYWWWWWCGGDGGGGGVCVVGGQIELTAGLNYKMTSRILTVLQLNMTSKTIHGQ